jgi:Rrf2 family protein
MKVSSRVDYALSCIIRVADRYNQREPVTVKDVAEKEKLQPDYVERLFVTMKEAGILKSVRGKTGGYVLATSPDKITAKDVMVAIERNTLELICFRTKGRRKKCIHFDDCKIRTFWEELKRHTESFLNTYTLARLIKLRHKEKNWEVM